VLREIRAHLDVPIIIVTGYRLDESDRVVSLELGADDYIVEPFGLLELLALVRAVLRRQEMGQVARTRDPKRGGYRFGGWQLGRRGRRLVDPNGAQVSLSKGEYALLLAFLRHLSGPSRASICCKPLESMKISSIGASMSRSCGCGVNWRSIRVRHAQSRPSAASATSSRCRSNRFEERTINDENMAPQLQS
jgi:hypothetical protein